MSTTPLVPAPATLLSGLPERSFAWLRDGEGLVGWGEAARLEVSGPDSFARARDWWSRLVADAETDEVAPTGSAGFGAGLVAFAGFAFSDRGTSTLVVPSTVLVRRGSNTWITRIGRPLPERAVEPVRVPGPVTLRPGGVSPESWREMVGDAVRAVRAGEAGKVVLARDVIAQADAAIDPRWLLHRLAQRYPQCWAFGVDGLVGATPELLLRVRDGVTTSLVLAGSAAPDAPTAELESAKNRDEHAFAVDSLVATLRQLGAEVAPVEAPHRLALPNVHHLATEVRGVLPPGRGLLDAAEAVHPTASVGGTPRAAALDLIARLEPADRGRYLGPVGWLDASGNGELGIALRCAQIEGSSARLWAGCGIVADSDPEQELAETELKLQPLQEALGL